MAMVYSWREQVFVHPVFVRGDGADKNTDPVLVLPALVGDAELGVGVREALAISRRLRRWDQACAARLLAAMGSRSWGAIERGARVVSVSETQDGITLAGLRWFEDRGNYENGMVGELDATLAAGATHQELGRAIRALLQMAEPQH